MKMMMTMWIAMAWSKSVRPDFDGKLCVKKTVCAYLCDGETLLNFGSFLHDLSICLQFCCVTLQFSHTWVRSSTIFTFYLSKTVDVFSRHGISKWLGHRFRLIVTTMMTAKYFGEFGDHAYIAYEACWVAKNVFPTYCHDTQGLCPAYTPPIFSWYIDMFFLSRFLFVWMLPLVIEIINLPMMASTWAGSSISWFMQFAGFSSSRCLAWLPYQCTTKNWRGHTLPGTFPSCKWDMFALVKNPRPITSAKKGRKKMNKLNPRIQPVFVQGQSLRPYKWVFTSSEFQTPL